MQAATLIPFDDRFFSLCPPCVSTPSVVVVRKVDVCRSHTRRALFFPVILRPYQLPHAERLLQILRGRRTAHDGSDCGTGKTYCAAHVARELGVKTLVVCPKSVIPTWEAILLDCGLTDFKVINWELAWRRLGRKIPHGNGSYFEWTETWPLFIFDEAHRAGSSTTMQGKMLIAAARQGRHTAGRILTLSATAADSPLKMRPLGFTLGLFELSAWFYWLDQHGCPEQTMGPKDKPERQWKERFFLKGRQAEVMAALNREIYEHRGARLRIADIPDFPPTQIGVRLIDGHEREVRRLSEDLRAFHAECSTKAALSQDDRAKLTYLREAMEVVKVPALVDMIEDALETGKVAVFCNYSKTLDALALECAKRKWLFGCIRGEQDGLYGPIDRQRTIDWFQADKLDVVLANVQAGGVGVSLHSLQKTPRTALLCPTFSAVDLKQCLGRVHRDGGGPSVQHLVYFRGTIEEKVAACVQRKIGNIELLNDGDVDDRQVELSLGATP